MNGFERAIDAALHKASMLMLHDQCTLNFAFAGNVAPLPGTFNCLVRPQTAMVAAPSVVTHFIEQPKPWDVLYPLRNARGWLDEFSAGLRHRARSDRRSAARRTRYGQR